MKASILLVQVTVFLACLGVGAIAQTSQQIPVDQSFEAVQNAVSKVGLTEIAAIDHARLAIAEGVEMPPSRVQIFSGAAVNTAILKGEIRAGLDLPFRVLSYDAAGEAVVTYTASEFIAQRHGLKDSPALKAFDAGLNAVFTQLDGVTATPAKSEGVDKNFAVVELKSQHGVTETVARLKKTITAQSDTIWFGDIDFQKEAADLGVTLVASQLLLFGGPAPGGVAMAQYPAIGLDAFCQKILVYEGADGKAVVLFSDIAELAKLAYGSSIKPHAMLNERLKATYSAAIQ